MTSIRTSASKRTSLPRSVDFAKSFLKDWERLSRSGRFDLRRLKEVLLLLAANDEPLGPEWCDHALSGAWLGHRECHVGGDFLLAYRLETSSKPEALVFVRAGTHSELFG